MSDLEVKRQVGGTHYFTMKVQPFDVIATWPTEQQIGFYRGNLLKYVMRVGTKGQDVNDVKKAHHYAEKLIAAIEKRGKIGNYDVKI
jgi:hypothetical protein